MRANIITDKHTQLTLISDSCIYCTPGVTEDKDGRGRYLCKTWLIHDWFRQIQKLWFNSNVQSMYFKISWDFCLLNCHQPFGRYNWPKITINYRTRLQQDNCCNSTKTAQQRQPLGRTMSQIYSRLRLDKPENAAVIRWFTLSVMMFGEVYWIKADPQ